MKFLRIVGVSGVTTTSGSLFFAGCGFRVGVAVVGGGVLLAGVAVMGGVVLLAGVAVMGGVTVIAGVTIPIAIVAHNIAITPGLVLLSFMVSAIP